MGVVFVINIYDAGRTFQQVANPYCRVVDNASQSELCRYALRDAGRESGLIVSKIAREAGGRWGFHALGLPCRGRTYKDSLQQIRQVCQKDTRMLMSQGSFSIPASSQRSIFSDNPRAQLAAAQPVREEDSS